MIIGLADLSLVEHIQSVDGFHRRIGGVSGLPGAVIDLAVGGVAKVKAIGAVLAQSVEGVALGAERLDLDGLRRPGGVDLIGHDALDIIRHAHHIDHIQIAAADAVVFKAAVVGLIFEPGFLAEGPDAQRMLAQQVQLVEDLIRPGDHHGIAGAAGAAIDQRIAGGSLGGGQLLLCLLRGGILPQPHPEAPGDGAGIGVVAGPGEGVDDFQRFVQRVKRIHLQTVRPHGLGHGQLRIGIGAAGEPQILIFQNGDLVLVLHPEGLHKAAAVVVIAQGIAGPRAGDILQIGGCQSVAVVIQADLHRGVVKAVCGAGLRAGARFRISKKRKIKIAVGRDAAQGKRQAKQQQTSKKFLHGAPHSAVGSKWLHINTLYNSLRRNAIHSAKKRRRFLRPGFQKEEVALKGKA